MNRSDVSRPLSAVLLLAALLLAGCRSGQAGAAPTPPAFLDAADRVSVRLDTPADIAALAGQFTVTVGKASVPVARVEAVADSAMPPTAQASAQEVVLAGTFQSVLGGTDWQTDGSAGRMQPVGGDRYALVVRLPAGHYEYKVVRGGTWAVNYGQGFAPGGANLTLTVPSDAWVRFEVDFARKTILNSVDDPAQVAPPQGPAAAPDTAAAGAAPQPARDITLVLKRPLGPSDIVQPMNVRLPDGTVRRIYARDVLSGPEYVSQDDDLGATYARTGTVFKVWCPVAASASLRLFAHAVGGSPRVVPLRRGAAGVWSASVPGDLNGTYYQYEFDSYGASHVAPDLYGRAAGADLQRSMVVDLARTAPAGWDSDAPPPLAAPTDAVVYELHVRDFTSDPSSGVPPPLRGTYLGLVAPGTTVPGTASPTGLDYLRRLGVTHVHVLPFQSINPGHAGGYNWGYETDLFDVPEPRYATDPNDPAGVIRQVKTMVAGLHRARLGLVMDVVYNHAVPVSGDASPFWATVPYYYFRTDFAGNLLNESGVGNALDDDRPMVRKFIGDSLVYWATQYHMDGFRFDLLGMFTPPSVRAWSAALRRVRPDILLYGEPWTGGGPTRFGKGAQRGLGVAVFNDNFRNALRGDLNGTQPGFALGGGGDAATLQTVFSGSPDFTASPTETMNYVSIHDDMTLWDKITQTLPADDPMDRRALKFAGAMVLLSQGVPILEGGAELGRTKQGQSNSYNLGDAVNHFDWQRGLEFADVSDYYRGLIAIRCAHPAFRCATADAVQRTLAFVPSAGLPPQTVAFTLDGSATGDAWRRTLVVFHGATDAAPVALPPGRWRVAVDGDQANVSGAPPAAATVTLAPLSAYVFYQDDPP